MKVSDETKGIFHKVGVWQGFKALFAERAQQALRDRMACPPDDVARNAAEQRAYQIYNSLTTVRTEIEDFANQQSVAKQGT